MKKKRLLMTGASGYLGSNLLPFLKSEYDIVGFYRFCPIAVPGVEMVSVDLLQREKIKSLVADIDPDIVLHTAAMANVDGCEQDPEQARHANVGATSNLTEALRGHHSKLIYISTDLVYDGIKGNFSENGPVGPPNVYGRTKLEGEKEALRKEGALVLRTNFFGQDKSGKKSIAQWAINELSSGRSIQGFSDAIFSSLYTSDMAQLIHHAINKNLQGVYNFGSSTFLSKYDFLVRIANRTGLDAGLIKPVSIGDFHFKAPRSKDLSLNMTKLKNALGINIPSIEESIENFFRDRVGKEGQYAI